MAIEVNYTPDFERQLKRLAAKYPSIYKDLDSIIDDLEINPQSGESFRQKFIQSPDAYFE